MAEGIQYDVFAALKVQGGAAFVADMDKAADAAEGLDDALGKIQGGAQRAWGGLSSLGAMASSVMGRVVAVGTAASAALAFGSAAAVVTTGKNLSELEGQATSLNAVIAASTERSFASVQGETGKLFEQFKSDAVQSAGGMADFVGIASKIAAPILGAGKGMADLREMTGGVLATASALKVPFEQAGSDIMRMLQGSAGADLPLFQAMKAMPALGIQSAEAFNQMVPEKKIELLRKAVSNPAILAAAEAAGNSFQGLWSTSEDLLTTMGQLALSPTFEVLRRGAMGLTKTLITGLDKGGPVRGALDDLGGTLGYRFGQIGAQLGRLFPDLNGSIESTVMWVDHLADQGLAKVVSATTWVADHWTEINTGAKAFAGWIASSAERALELVRTLGGGDLAKGVERAALLYGGSKVAAPAWAMASGGAQMAQGAAKAGQWAWGLVGAGGAAAGAAEAGAAGAAAGAAGGTAGAATTAAGGTAAAIGGAGALATGGLLAGAAGFVAVTLAAIEADTFGFFDRVSQDWQQFTAESERLWSSVKGLGRQLGSLWDAVTQLYESMKPLLDLFASIYTIPLALFFSGVEQHGSAAAHVIGNLAQQLQVMAGTAEKAVDKTALWVNKIVNLMGLGKYESPPEDRGRFEVNPDMMGGAIVSTGSTLSAGSGTAKKPPSSSAKQQVEVTIKWDLGEGDQDALFVRTRRDVVKMVQESRSRVVSLPPFRSR